MPKGNRGGRRTATQPTQATQVSPTPTITMTPSGTITFTNLTDQQASDLRDEVDSIYEPSVLDAIKQYISKKTDSSGYSMSQNMNHKLNNDLPLNANEKFMTKYLEKGMHPIGKDTILYRGAHEDFLKRLGINNYQKYSDAQLKQKLTGATFASKSFSSTSYDKSKNPFYTGVNSGGREVEIVIKAPKTTKMVFGARSQAEIILNRGTQYKVTDIKYTGRTATPRGAGRKPVVQVELEVIG